MFLCLIAFPRFVFGYRRFDFFEALAFFPVAMYGRGIVFDPLDSSRQFVAFGIRGAQAQDFPEHMPAVSVFLVFLFRFPQHFKCFGNRLCILCVCPVHSFFRRRKHDLGLFSCFPGALSLDQRLLIIA